MEGFFAFRKGNQRKKIENFLKLILLSLDLLKVTQKLMGNHKRNNNTQST